MINLELVSEEKSWSKKIKKKEIFFNSICKSFPIKYQFINKNKPTDILSFPFQEKLKLRKKLYLGDIIISFNFMNKAKNKKINLFKDRVIKTFIHGYLHLLGFDHIKLKDYQKMLKEEQKIYQSVIKKIN